ncbi:MAG: sigma-70 family RNA polymerase sigma factor [Planctomycetes bacterium]|nr:sigma-70 family RNA polymerase sigma factor [Planctomycetota bacterium]
METGWPDAILETTHWSKLTVKESSEDERRAAYAYFYDRYRGVVYRYFRRGGLSRDEAADLVQAFYATALGRTFLERADPKRGRFRDYLRKAAGRFLVDYWRRPRPRTLSLEGLIEKDAWGKFEPVSESEAPDEEFDRDWARAILEAAIRAAAARYEKRGRSDDFRAFLLRTHEGRSSREIGAALGIPEGRVDNICSRARARVAREIRREVAATVQGPGEVEEEIRRLLELLE